MKKEKRTVEVYQSCIICGKDLLIQSGKSFYKLTHAFDIASPEDLPPVLKKYCVRLLKDCLEEGV